MRCKMRERPIGVFDSGVGGLTVLDELIKKLPNENYLYIADEANCPYGTKTNDEIETCVVNLVYYLIKQNVKAIVIACNTASLFVDKVRKLTTIPIIDVIEPTSSYAIKVSKNKCIGVLGTSATIKKGTYQKILKENNVNTYPVACSEFVDYIENNDINSDKAFEIVNNKLECLKNTDIDTIIYGCTHFSILEKPIKKLLGQNINYIACGHPTSIKLYEILKENNLLNTSTTLPVINVYTTGNVEKTKKAMSWYKKIDEVKHINL